MKIFISYSHKNENELKQILLFLQSHMPDSNVWYDTHIKGGTDWSESITQAIIDCDVCLILLSHEWTLSKFCLQEFDMAKNHNKQVLPVRIDEVALPSYLEAIQMIDLSNGIEISSKRADLVKTLYQLLSKKIPSPAIEPSISISNTGKNEGILAGSIQNSKVTITHNDKSPEEKRQIADAELENKQKNLENKLYKANAYEINNSLQTIIYIVLLLFSSLGFMLAISGDILTAIMGILIITVSIFNLQFIYRKNQSKAFNKQKEVTQLKQELNKIKNQRKSLYR